MTNKLVRKTVTLPEHSPMSLGAPFKVVLVNSVRQVIGQEGTIERTIIPNERGLLQQIALARILIPRRLNGKELKFIRKAVPIKASSLADKVGVSPEHLCRCEGGERALSVGTEKCLRVAILLELFKIPKEVECQREQSDSLDRKLLLFRKAMETIQAIIGDMTIPSAYDLSDELAFYFTTVSATEKDFFGDEPEADWTPQPLAA